MLLKTSVHHILLVVFIPELLKLLLFFTVLIDLGFELAFQLFDRGLETLDLRLLKVEFLKFVLLRLVLANVLRIHALDLLTKLSKGWLLQRNLLTTVSLLFFELYGLLLLRSLTSSCSCTGTDQSSKSSHSAVLHHTLAHGAGHSHLLGHGWVLREFLVDSLDNSCKRRVLPVPALDGRPLVFDGHGVK